MLPDERAFLRLGRSRVERDLGGRTCDALEVASKVYLEDIGLRAFVCSQYVSSETKPEKNIPRRSLWRNTQYP